MGGIAWADIPDGGVIHGCYKATGGSLRVIDTSTAETCNPSEKPLSWNQTGPTGAAGASLFANVDSDGTLRSGTAVSASFFVSPPFYRVIFSQDVTRCAAVANTGNFAGVQGGLAEGVVASTLHSGFNGDPHSVDVHLRDADTGLLVESQFSLIVTC
jgi:hypothetical protein